ncbi:MAG: carbohydrate ABC transporter permease [Armatimonadetes bacterium]|nr:carbohydrate ABC transporter permease [Armatimonadota bacterium]
MTERSPLAYISGAIKYIILVTYLALVIFPMFWVLYTSAKSTEEIYRNPFGLPKLVTSPDPESWLTLARNYEKAWVKSHFSSYFLNSVKVVAISLVLILLLSAMAAYILARFDFKGNRFLFYLFLSGLMIPMQLTLIPLFFQFTWLSDALTSLARPLGDALHIGKVTVSLHDTHAGLILIYVAASLPFTIFILTSFFRTLPNELKEAAVIDGASEATAFWQVMLPLAKPGIVTVAIFNFLGLWNEYLFALVFINNDVLKTLPLGLASISIQAQYKSDFGLMFAGLVIVMLPTLAVYIILQEKLTKGITMGALKG